MSVLKIKNMVCPRCIESVKNIFNQCNLTVQKITLGEVSVLENVTTKQKQEIGYLLNEKGFDLLDDHNSAVIEKIKTIIIKSIHHSSEELKVNYSTILSEELNMNYSSLSRLFSSTEGMTIERFIKKQRIERVKEFIFYNEKTLSEIAFLLGFSSAAHLSTQFKSETGMTPSKFKSLSNKNRKSIDGIA